MFVTYIQGIYDYWGGTPRIIHYTSTDMIDWKMEEPLGVTGVIDASVFQMPDGKWKMWFKDGNSNTSTAVSDDLYKWELAHRTEIKGHGHEAPVIFYWKNMYWLIIDPCSLAYTGLVVYKSENGTDWIKSNDILNSPGIRPDDKDQGRHADVLITDDRAFIIYFTHPGRDYDEKGVEIYKNDFEYRRSSIQAAELFIRDGKMVCDRDKYSK